MPVPHRRHRLRPGRHRWQAGRDFQVCLGWLLPWFPESCQVSFPGWCREGHRVSLALRRVRHRELPEGRWGLYRPVLVREPQKPARELPWPGRQPHLLVLPVLGLLRLLH